MIVRVGNKVSNIINRFFIIKNQISTQMESTSSKQGSYPSEDAELKLGLNAVDLLGDSDDDVEVEHEDDPDLIAYQQGKGTPKIVVQEFEGEDKRSDEFNEL